MSWQSHHVTSFPHSQDHTASGGPTDSAVSVPLQMRGPAADAVNVKRLPKRPAPPRFGRKLSAAQKTRATHICLDWCGAARSRTLTPRVHSPTRYRDQILAALTPPPSPRSGFIYFLAAPFEDLPKSYECPQCNAPKKRFAGYDAETGKTVGGTALPQIVNIAGLIGVAGLVALVGVGLLE